MQKITIYSLLMCITFMALPLLAQPFDGSPTKGNLSVWRINASNGQVSLCSFEGKNSPPTCYPWSDSAEKGQYRLLAGDDLLSTWRMNEISGSVSMCEYSDVAKKPHCTPWGK